MKLLNFFLFYWIFLIGAVGFTQELCPPGQAITLQQQSETLWQTSCVSTCAKVYAKNSSEDLKFFEKNCRYFSEQEKKPYTFSGAVKETGKILDKALLQCLPLAVKKAAVGVYELAAALPGMISYLLSGSWASTEFKDRPDVAAEMKLCSESKECRRAMARNSIRFQKMNSDGSWVVTDEDVDRQIASMSFNDLHQQALHDRPMTKSECERDLASLRKEISSDGEDWTKERHQKVYDRLSQKFPHCPGALSLTSPALIPDEEPSETTEQCLRRNPEPLQCLSFGEKLAVGTVCRGKDFEKEYDELQVDFCGEVVQYLVPIPFVGPQTKLIPKALGIKTATRTAEKAVETEVKLAASSTAKVLSTEQRSFVEAYKSKVFVGEEQNRKFIASAESANQAAAANKSRYFDVENSVMKKLNDQTGDKELVTSLTNYQKETVLKRLDVLKKKYPDIEFDVYSDFKSVKISMKSAKEIDPATNKKILEDLNQLYGESNKELVAKLKELNVAVPEAGETDKWFRAGYGKTADEAALSARKARQNENAKVLDYESEQVRGVMSQRLQEVEKYRQEISTSPRFTSLMEKSANGVSLPREDVFDLVRKNESPEKLAAAVSNRYGIKNFTSSEALQLQDYVKGVDEFSPTILIAKRETANLDNASSGGASADFLGMGAANLKATAEGIAGKSSLDQALVGARKGEKEVTKTFQKRMEAFKKTVGDATCSGDDCIVARALTDKEKTRMMSDLAKNSETRGVRMSFIGPQIAKETRMQLASHGESIEKAFRKELEGKVSYDKLNKMTFGFDMKTTKLNSGTVDLIIGKTGGTRLSVKEQAEVQRAFQRAIEKSNAEAGNYVRGQARYSEKRVFGVGGVLGLSDDGE